MQRIKKTYRSKTVSLVRKMYQTEKYKLNLIEPSDPFLPDGLNANTQRIEDVLLEKMEGPVVDLDARVTALEAHKFAYGHFIGTGSSFDPAVTTEYFVHLGFRPKAGILMMSNGTTITYMEGSGLNSTGFRPVDDGFYAGYPVNTGMHVHVYYVWC